MEEVGEFTTALGNGANKRHIGEEAADVLVTLLGASFAAGLTFQGLTEGIYAVIAKNDA
jgi:NTP pyrophosphatase (non-canonical NTP hydrolase)